MKKDDMKQLDEMRAELREEFRKLGLEVAEVKTSSAQNTEHLKALALDVRPIVEIYQTWSKIGKWTKPLLFSLSLVVAIVAGILQIWRKIP